MSSVQFRFEHIIQRVACNFIVYTRIALVAAAGLSIRACVWVTLVLSLFLSVSVCSVCSVWLYIRLFIVYSVAEPLCATHSCVYRTAEMMRDQRVLVSPLPGTAVSTPVCEWNWNKRREKTNRIYINEQSKSFVCYKSVSAPRARARARDFFFFVHFDKNLISNLEEKIVCPLCVCSHFVWILDENIDREWYSCVCVCVSALCHKKCG